MSSLTIVIPTRERCDTLAATLRSCVHQKFPEMAILVVDNASKDKTAEVVGAFRDPRVVYVNTGERLPMSANWEFALDHVRTEYVMFLGDDDAVLPDAASALMSLVDSHRGVDAISWPSIEYGWPSCGFPEARNFLAVPMRTGIEHRSAPSMLTEVVGFRRPYQDLPFLYKGLVRVGAVDSLRAASGGKVFHSSIPDVYFGVASCAVIGDYLYSNRAYTINGASGHSTGVSTFAGPEGQKAKHKFMAEANIPYHPALQFAPSIPIIVMETLLQARSRLPALGPYQPDFDAMVVAAVGHTRRAAPHVFSEVMSALTYVANANPLKPETKQILANASNRPFHAVPRVHGRDIFKNRLLVDCQRFHVEDVFTASLLADVFLRLGLAGELSLVATAKSSVGLLRREVTKRTGLFGQSAAAAS